MNKKQSKIWAMYVQLAVNAGYDGKTEPRPFLEEVWDYIIDGMSEAGMNTILLQVDDAVEFGSHPEIAHKNAWSRGRMRKEIAKCKEKGLKIIPLFNFAATHDGWLGEYHRKLSTPEYYRVCNDIIKEAYELFDHPEYIHLGMDEEDEKHVRKLFQLPVYRKGDLYWHDLRFLIDCVVDTGAKPWIWADPLFDNPEEFKKHIDPDELVLSPWYYNAIRKEHWTPVETRAEYVAYYNEGQYAEMGIKYVEEDPFLVNFRKLALPLMEDGFKYVPCTSVHNRCDWNTYDMYEYFKENAPDNNVVGFLAAPWSHTYKEKLHFFEETWKFFKEAKEKFYKED